MSRARLRTYLIILAILINFLNFLPILDSPYLEDDAWRESSLRGTLSLTNTDLTEVAWNTARDYIRDGRWYPLVVYYYAAFYYLDLYAYKAVGIFFIVLNILFLGYLVRLITGSRNLALMAIGLAPMFFQLRFYHDPILAYYYLMQIECLFIELSLISLIHYLRTSRIVFFVFSNAAFLVVLLVYEAFYGFCILFALVAYFELGRDNAKRILAVSAPFVLMTLVNLGISLFVRAHFHPNYDGITLSYDLWAWFATFAKQVVAAVPLSYFLLGNPSQQTADFAVTCFLNDLIALCLLWMALWSFIWDYREEDEHKSLAHKLKALIPLGIGFWLLPAVLISFSAKYQRELRWGLGYLPVYVSSFGIMMLVLSVLAPLHHYCRKWGGTAERLSAVLLALLGTAVIGLNYTSNRIVIHAYNCEEHNHRSLVEKALKCNLMRRVPEGSYLVFGLPNRAWDEAAFYRMFSGRTLQVVKAPGFEMESQLGSMTYQEAFSCYAETNDKHLYDFMNSGIPRICFAGYKAEFNGSEGVIVARKEGPNTTLRRPRVFFIKYEAQAKGLGYAVLGRLTRLRTTNGSDIEAAADRIAVYVGIPVGTPETRILLTGTWVDRRSMKPAGVFRFTDKDLKVSASDENGRVLEIPKHLMRQPINPASMVATLTMMGE